MALHHLGGPTRRHKPVQSFTPLNLFAGSVKGAWFDPSDISTLFQDSAGTTPVTAVEQPVGLMKDKSGNGKDALQATAGNRPTYRARYNLLTNSQGDYATSGSGSWELGNAATLTTNNVADPFGGTAAATFTLPATGRVAGYATLPVTTYNGSIWLQGSGTVRLNIMGSGYVSRAQLIVNLTGTWTRYSVSGATIGGDTIAGINLDSVAGATVTVYGRQMTYGSTLMSYQSITTATSYNAVGFLPYLAFNGTSSAMATASIPFTAAQMSVFAGLTKSSDAAVGMVAETSANANATAGTFFLDAPAGAASSNIGFTSGGTTPVLVQNTGIAAPITLVITGIGDISAPLATTRSNQVQVTSSGSQGTGAFTAQPLNIGARNNGGSLWFTGNLYGLIVRGASSTAAETASTEAWMDGKTGAY